jgi:hypothetical protein
LKPLLALESSGALAIVALGGCAGIVGIGDLPRPDGGGAEPPAGGDAGPGDGGGTQPPPGRDAGSNPLAGFLGSWTYTGTMGGSCGLNGAGQFNVTQSGPSSIVVVLPACSLPATVTGQTATFDQGDSCTVYSSTSPDAFLETVQGQFTVVGNNQGRFIIGGTVTDETTGASCTYNEDANALRQ